MNTPLQQPQISIRCAGAGLQPSVAAALGEIRVRHVLSHPGSAELVFRGSGVDPDELSGLFTPGTELEIGESGAVLFRGSVTGVEFSLTPSAPPEFRVHAGDALDALLQRQKVRAFVEFSVADIAGDLVSDLGLTVRGESGPRWPRLIQHRQTDLELLRHICAQAGLVFTLRGTVLHLLTQAGDGSGITFRAGRDLRELRVEASPHQVWSGVSASAWNPHTIRPCSGEASGADGRGARKLVTRTMAGEGHAEALARAELDRRQASRVCIHAAVDGNAALAAGGRVSFEGAGREWRGPHVVTTLEHRIDPQHGFVSVIGSRPEEPSPPRSDSETLTLPAVVVRIDDPQSLGRVRVTLTTAEDVETDWMPVVLPALGRNKGVIALPDAGDRVLVLCPGGDPSLGVVLGGLADPDHPPPAANHGGRTDALRMFTTQGQSLTLDAHERLLLLESKSGGKLRISRSGTLLHSEGDLVMEAPGKTITIRAAAINFEQS